MFGLDRRVVEALRLVVMLFEDIIAAIEATQGLKKPPLGSPALCRIPGGKTIMPHDAEFDLSAVLVWLRYLGKRLEATGLLQREPSSRYDP